MIKGLDHVGTDHQCNVCQCDFTDDEGGVQGYLGILPVAFCPTCFAGLCDMVGQLNEREWQGLTKEERHEISLKYKPYVANIMAEHEAELKRRNTDED